MKREYAEVIINNFEKTIGKNLSNVHRNKLKKVIKAFYKSNNQIISLEMGQGKSTILSEFIKYMCSVDKNFSAVIVKKTLKEAEEFVIDLGFKNKALEGISVADILNKDTFETISDEERIKGLTKIYKQTIDSAGENINEQNQFVGVVLRGFNKKECLKKEIWGITSDKTQRTEEYQPDVCLNCPFHSCPVFIAKCNSIKHRIAVVTHQRLFMCSYSEDLLNNILYWKDKEGNKQKRKLLIVDEKFNLVDNASLDFDIYKELIEEISNKDKKLSDKIDTYVKKIEFPTSFNNDPIAVEKFDKDFEFDKKIKRLHLGSLTYTESILKLEKFLRYGGTSSKEYPNSSKCLNYCRYIDTRFLTNNFKSITVLDATSKVDSEYFGRNNLVTFNDSNLKINLFYNKDKKLSKSKIVANYKQNVSDIAKDLFDIIENNEKTLIVCYKTINIKENEFFFENYLKQQLDELKVTKQYSIVHFGAATTGVNNFNDFDTIVFLGELLKVKNYYYNKALTLNEGRKMDIYTTDSIKRNEIVIDTIQQIGRIRVRKGETGNVFMLGTNEDTLERIKKYFKVKKCEEYKMKNYLINEDLGLNKHNIGHRILIILRDKLVKKNNSISLKSITEQLEDVEIDSIKNAMRKNKKLINFMKENHIKYYNSNKRFLKTS